MSVIFDFIRKVLAVPLGVVMSLFYTLTNNYILTIILLTVCVKLCFLPNRIKKQREMVAGKAYNEKIKLTKARYASDTEKLEKKLAELKKEEPKRSINTGWPATVVLIAVMIGLLGVIYTPLTNVLHIDKDTIAEMKVVMDGAYKNGIEGEAHPEIALMKEAHNFRQELLAGEILSEEEIDTIIEFREDYNFMGIDLAANPALKEFNNLWLFPILVFVSGLMTPVYAFIKRKKMYPNGPKFAAIEALPFLSPMLTFLFSFLFSSGVVFYWTISNCLSFLQMLILNAIYDPTKITVALDDVDNETEMEPNNDMEPKCAQASKCLTQELEEPCLHAEESPTQTVTVL